MTDKIVNKNTGREIWGRFIGESSLDPAAFWFQIEDKPMGYFLSTEEWELHRGFELPTKQFAIVAPKNRDSWDTHPTFVFDLAPIFENHWLYLDRLAHLTDKSVLQYIEGSGIECHIVFEGVDRE